MLRLLSACVLLLALTPVPAAAEWHFVPLLGVTFKGASNIYQEVETTGIDTRTLAAEKTHTHLAGAVNLLGEGILGVEAFATWTPGFFDIADQQEVESSHTATLMGNIVLTTPRKWTEYGLRPYLSGGFGLMHATVKSLPSPGASELVTSVNSGGYNIGAGAIGFFSERTGVRFDFRYHSTMRRNSDTVVLEPNTDGAYLRHMTLSVGIVWRRR